MNSAFPLLEALQYFTVRPHVPTDNSPFSQFFRTCEIPSVEAQAIQGLCQRLTGSASPLQETIQLSDTFHFSSKELKKLLEFSDDALDDSQKTNVLLIIFKNSIAFLCLDEESEKDIINYYNHLVLVIKSLTTFQAGFTKSLFWFLYVIVLAKAIPKLPVTYHLVNLICTQIESSMIENPNSLSIFVDLLKKIKQEKEKVKDSITDNQCYKEVSSENANKTDSNETSENDNKSDNSQNSKGNESNDNQSNDNKTDSSDKSSSIQSEDDSVLNAFENSNLEAIESKVCLSIQKLIIVYDRESIEYDEVPLVEMIKDQFFNLEQEEMNLITLIAKNKYSKNVLYLYESLPRILCSIDSDFVEENYKFAEKRDFIYAQYDPEKKQKESKNDNDNDENNKEHKKHHKKKHHHKGIENDEHKHDDDDDYDDLNGEYTKPHVKNNKTTGYFLTPCLRKQMKSIIYIFNYIHYAYIDGFFGKFAEIAHDSYKNYFIFLYFLTHINFNHETTKEVFDALVWDKLFVPSVTIFNVDHSFNGSFDCNDEKGDHSKREEHNDEDDEANNKHKKHDGSDDDETNTKHKKHNDSDDDESNTKRKKHDDSDDDDESNTKHKGHSHNDYMQCVFEKNKPVCPLCLTSFYRERVVMITIVHAPKYILDLFEKYQKYPFLFAELAARVLGHLPNVYSQSFRSKQMFSKLIKVQNNLRKIKKKIKANKTKSDQDGIKMSVSARSAIFHLIMKLLHSPLSKNLTLKSFVNSLSDKSFSKSLFKSLSKDSRMTNCAFLINAFHILSKSKPPEWIMHKLVQKTSVVISKEPEASSSLLLALFENLNSYPNLKILNYALDIMVNILSKSHKVNFVNAFYIELSLIIPKTKMKSFDRLFQLLAASDQVKVGMMFVISKPSFLITIFSALLRLGEIDILFGEMSKLCDYSNYNCLQFFRGEIDLLLLRMIYNFPEDFVFRGSNITNLKGEDKIFKLIIPLFLKIAGTRSSEITAERMIRIISPHEDGKVSPIAAKFIESVSPLNKTLRPYLKTGFPIGIQQQISEYINIPYQYLNKGSTIAFTLYVDKFLSSKVIIKPSIFQITISNVPFIEILIEATSLICAVYEGNKRTEVAVAQNIPTNRWNLITIQIHELMKSQLQINTVIDLNTHSKYSHTFPIKSGEHEMFNIKVGNQTKFSGDKGILSCIFQLGSFTYFDHLINDYRIFDDFVKSSSSSLTAPINTDDSIKNTEINPITNPIYVSTLIPNLIIIFRYFFPLERYLPIFNQYDIYTPEYSILIIKTLPGFYGPKISKVFSVLPYFLTKTSQPITYEHYLAFYDYLQVCSTLNDKFSLFDSVILNLSTWLSVDAFELQKMLDHISTKVYHEYPNYFMQEDFFKKFVGCYRILLSNEQKSEKEENIKLLMNKLDLLVLNRVKVKFTREDCDLMLNSILSSKNFQLVEHLMSLMPSLLQYTKPSENHVYSLLNVQFDKDPNLFSPLIHCLKIASEDFFGSIILLESRVPETFYYNQFFDDVVHFPEMFPIAFFIAINNDRDTQLRLIDIYTNFSSDPDKKDMIKKCYYWPIWPIIFGLQVDRELQKKVAVYLSQMLTNPFDKDNLDLAIISLKFFEVSCTFDTVFLATQILVTIYNISSEVLNSKQLSTLVKRFFLVMFCEFRFGSHSQKMIKLFKNSPFQPNSHCTIENHAFDDTNRSEDDPNNNSSDNDKKDKEIECSCPVNNNDNGGNEVYEFNETNCNDFFSRMNHYFMTLTIIPPFSQLKSMDDAFRAFHFEEKHEIRFMIIFKTINNALKTVALLLANKIPNNLFSKLITLLLTKDNSPKNTPAFDLEVLKYHSSIITPFLLSLRQVAKKKRYEIQSFFNRFWTSIHHIESIQIIDPLIFFKKEIQAYKERTFKQYLSIMRKFIFSEEVIETMNEKIKTEYHRSFLFSDNFNTLLIKKTVKHNNHLIKNSSERVFRNQNFIISSWTCLKIGINSQKKCMFCIAKCKIIIDIEKRKQIEIKASEIIHILTRNRLQRPTAIEFFTNKGSSYLLDFAPVLASEVMKKLESIRMKNLINRENSNFAEFICEKNLLRKWKKGKITNYDFLLKLNMFTGRSFKDTENYIIFPFVQLTDKKIRDFSLPMPIQNPKRLAHFFQTAELNNFMFGTAPSNSMLLSYYFLRLEPYTTLHKNINDGHFDVAGRMFNSFPQFMNSLLNGDEWKECSPEFYSFPEVFIDLNQVMHDALKTAQSENNMNIRLSIEDGMPQMENLKTSIRKSFIDRSFKNDLYRSNYYHNFDNKPSIYHVSSDCEKVNTLMNSKNNTNGSFSENGTNYNKSRISDFNNESSASLGITNNDENSNSLNQTENENYNENDNNNNSDDSSNQSESTFDEMMKIDKEESSSSKMSTSTQNDDNENDNVSESIADDNMIKTEFIRMPNKHSTININELEKEIEREKDPKTNEAAMKKSMSIMKTKEREREKEKEKEKVLELENSKFDLDAENENKINKNFLGTDSDEGSFEDNIDEDEDDNELSKVNSANNNSKNNNNNNYNNNTEENENVDNDSNLDNLRQPNGDLSTRFKSIFDFVYTNRKVLESEYVSSHLGEWIDMIWGVNQHNRGGDIWIPYLYNNCWEKFRGSDKESDRAVIPVMLSKLGSIPPQVFFTHVRKQAQSSFSKYFDRKTREIKVSDSPRMRQTMKTQYMNIMNERKPTTIYHGMFHIKLGKLKGQKRSSSKNSFIFKKDGELRFIVSFEDGTIQSYRTDIKNKVIKPNLPEPMKLKIPEDSRFVYQKENIFIFNTKADQVYCINFDKLVTFDVKLVNDIDFACGLAKFGNMVVASKYGSINLWNYSHLDFSPLPCISMESICCMTVNTKYKVIIYCTNDGYLRIYSVPKKKIFNSVKINCIGEKILTTKNWAFLIVYEPGWLHLFTINGLKIKSIQIDFEVYNWCTFSDQKGFDYVCCVDPIGYVYTFEAYYIENIEMIAGCRDRIIQLYFNDDPQCIVAHGSSSKVYFISYVI